MKRTMLGIKGKKVRRQVRVCEFIALLDIMKGIEHDISSKKQGDTVGITAVVEERCITVQCSTIVDAKDRAFKRKAVTADHPIGTSGIFL